MSYYILTPDSNLGNILSTETISPASLYGRRSHGFGKLIAAWDIERPDFIRLRSQMPPAPTKSDDFNAMVLELDEDLIHYVQADGSGSMWTSETIRITPTKCRFVFYSQEDLDTAFNSTQRSIEAKFAGLYRKKAKVRAANGASGPTLFDELDESVPRIEGAPPEDIARFEMIDRFKGAIFGYCLGDDISPAKEIRPDFIDFMTTVDNMINAVTQAPVDRLKNSQHILESVLYKFALRNELKGMTPEIRHSFDLDKQLSAIRNASSVELPIGMRNDSFKLNMYRSELENRMREAAGRRPKSYGRPTILADGDTPKLNLPNKDGDLAANLLNCLIYEDILSSTNRTLGYPFALLCGKMTREYLGDLWESSGERSYINKLLPHLNAGDEFDSENTSAIEDEKSRTVLKLIAHLCERPDNKELDSFYRFLLIKCKVTDFSLAFALWGAVFGFSELPKTLCDAMSSTAESAARKLFSELLTTLNR